MPFLSLTTQKASPLTLIEGPKSDGQCWSSLVADLLTNELQCSSRFKRVIVISFDRSLSDIESCVGMNNDEKSADRHADCSKLQIVQAFDVLAGVRTLDELLDGIIQMMCSHSFQISHISNELSEGNVGIVIYSLSSAILSQGRSKVLKSLKRLLSCLNSDDSRSRVTVIGTLHSSLHSEKELVLLRKFADTYCHLTPNLGSLSSVVAVEGHCIRRGGGGRVSEIRELFSFEDSSVAAIQQARHQGKNTQQGHRQWVPHRLKALPKVKIEATESGDNNSAGDDQRVDSAESVLRLMVPKESRLAATEKGGTDASRQTDKEDGGTIMAARRLVTFNSTDPEFDEDSDPDADLDL